MHDDIGAHLTEISILSELERRRGDGDGSESRIDRIAESSRALLDEIGQIIWAVDPGNDRLDQLVAYVREFAAEFIEGAGVRGRYTFPGDVPPAVVSAQFRRNVFLVVKEATRNAVVHGRPREIDIRVAVTDDALSIEIADDGCGFDPQVGRVGGNGLKNLRHRADEIGGTLTIDASAGNGSVVRLRVPLANHRFG